MNQNVCPVHGESRPEQVEAVLSKLSEEDLRILCDSTPLSVITALSTVSATRCLGKIHLLKAGFQALVS
jgi:hypothetical protein